MPAGLPSLGALGDLGLGDMLNTQRDDMTEEEKRKRRLGMATGGGLDYGRTGIASIDLGMGMAGAGRR